MSAEPAEPVNVEDNGSEGSRITLKITGSSGYLNEIWFALNTTTKMEAVKASYSARVGIPVAKLKFRYCGIVVRDGYTPSMLEMCSGDEIKAYQVNINTEE